MDKKELLQALEERADDYRRHRPTTAEMDIAIIRAYCSRKNAVQVAMDIPCSESTVYRAIRRVHDFLQGHIATTFIEALRQHLTQYSPSFGDCDTQSVLEMLYVTYLEHNDLEGEDIKAGFAKLDNTLSDLPLTTVDNIIDEVCALCHSHERNGFTEGLKLGVKLGNELNK